MDFIDTKGYCQAMTNSGSQCKRKALRAGLCKQHHSLKKGRGKGNISYDTVPEPPISLSEFGMIHWQIYCQYLIEKNQLIEAYLFGVAELCHLEAQLEKVEQKVKEYGYVNKHNNGFQRNGYASHQDKIQQHIRNLRADYGFTVASEKGRFQEERVSSYSNHKSKEW
jgi:phage terminase small subunit